MHRHSVALSHRCRSPQTRGGSADWRRWRPPSTGRRIASTRRGPNHPGWRPVAQCPTGRCRPIAPAGPTPWESRTRGSTRPIARQQRTRRARLGCQTRSSAKHDCRCTRRWQRLYRCGCPLVLRGQARYHVQRGSSRAALAAAPAAGTSMEAAVEMKVKEVEEGEALEAVKVDAAVATSVDWGISAALKAMGTVHRSRQGPDLERPPKCKARTAPCTVPRTGMRANRCCNRRSRGASRPNSTRNQTRCACTRRAWLTTRGRCQAKLSGVHSRRCARPGCPSCSWSRPVHSREGPACRSRC